MLLVTHTLPRGFEYTHSLLGDADESTWSLKSYRVSFWSFFFCYAMKGTFISNRFGGQGSLSLEFRRKVTGFAKPISRSRSKRTHTHKKKNVPKFYRFFVIFFLICVLKFHSSLLSLGIKAANAKKNTRHGNGNHLNWFRRLFRYSFFFCWCCRRVVFFKGGGAGSVVCWRLPSPSHVTRLVIIGWGHKLTMSHTHTHTRGGVCWWWRKKQKRNAQVYTSKSGNATLYSNRTRRIANGLRFSF